MVEAALSMLIQANLPSRLWPFALKHAIHVRNRVPHSTTGSTPYLSMTNNTQSLKHIGVFGCTAYVLRQPPRSKLESRAYEGVYLKTMEHGVYEVLIENDDGELRIAESRHATLDESRFNGASGLEEYTDDGYKSDKTDSESEVDEVVYIDVSDDKISSTGVPIQESESNAIIKSSSSNMESEGYHSAGTKIDFRANDAPQTSRYPTRRRSKAPAWYTANAAKCCDDITITTSDDPTLAEARSANTQEHEMLLSAIE